MSHRFQTLLSHSKLRRHNKVEAAHFEVVGQALNDTLAAALGEVRSGQRDKISHIDMGDDRIDTVISHIISPYPVSISRMTIIDMVDNRIDML